MAAFQDNRAQTEQKVMVRLLSEIERNPSFTQRTLATELGIALGLMNQYLKRCVTKGWVRASQISPKRITYFLTPEGFQEKSHMVTAYLGRSLTFFRDARTQLEAAYAIIRADGATKIALAGDGDLADIANLVAHGTGLHAEIVTNDADLKNFDAVVITDVISPQATFDRIVKFIPASKIITLELLHISRTPPVAGDQP